MEELKKRLERLYNENCGRFYAAAYTILQSRESAEDAVSETFLRLIESREKLESLSDGEQIAYARTVLKNIAIDMVRKRRLRSDKKSDDEIADISASVEGIAEGGEAYAMLVEHIRSLPPSLKEALYLRVNYGFGAKQIAKALGISSAAARKRLSDTYRHIRKFKEEHGNE